MHNGIRALAVLIAASPLAALAAEIPLADFARHSQFRDVKISPEGDYLAASAVVDGKAVLSLVRVEDMKGVNLRPREGGEVYRFWWVAPHRVIYSIAERMSRIYNDIIYIPHAIEVDGQIIKVYDPSIHKEVKSASSEDESNVIRKEALDRRYVACKRPIIITGGELTLEMLDLRYDESAKYYEAPLHMKALGGTFIIDDFGRQLVKPEQLLNRWIVPLESRVDFLKLHTGKTFSIPFDEIVVFSTNLEPNDLMDPAFLRRIPYKLEIKAPSREEYRRIFRLIATQRGVEMPDDVATLVIEELQTSNGFQLACYQPRFVVDQVIAACKYLDIPTAFSPELVLDALGNMYVSGTWSQKVTSIAA